MGQAVTYMRSDHNVAKVQRFFGVEPRFYNGKYGSRSENGQKRELLGKGNTRCEDINGNTNGEIPDLGLNNGNHRSGYNLRSRTKPNKNGVSDVNKIQEIETNGTATLAHTIPQTEDVSVKRDKENGEPKYIINSKFWFYLFHFGALLGNETFLISFLPWCSWNMSEWLTRGVVIMWVVVMYFGQSTKDIVRWPRPSSPALRLEDLYWNEYGMPSTHAMMGVCIPFTILNMTMDKYQYPYSIAVVICVIWCCLVCCSRLYLGMHNLLDVSVGVIYATVIMCILLPYLDILDVFFTQHTHGATTALGIGLAMVLCYPTLDRWSNARADATLIVGSGAGLLVGKWFKNEYGIGPDEIIEEPPYDIVLPSLIGLLFMLLRTLIGIVILLLSKEIVSIFIYNFVGTLLGISQSEAKSTAQLVIELPRKFFGYFMVGFNACVLCPWVFANIGFYR